jgi:hypothetical protein
MVIYACGLLHNPAKVPNFQYGQNTVKTPNFRQKVHPEQKVRKPWQIWFIFSLQDVLERKKMARKILGSWSGECSK